MSSLPSDLGLRAYVGVPDWVSAWTPGSRATADALLDEMILLAKAGAALDLRLARVLAWAKRQDLAPIGYSSFTAFCRERVEWRLSWLRQVIRLVESDLEVVKAAVCRGGLQLTTAVRAPGKVASDEQELWLLAALRGEVVPTRPRRAPSRKSVVLKGRAAREVHRARDLARLVVGQPLSNPTADDFVLECWREGASGEQILSKARETPPVPEHPPLPPWCGKPDPATRLVGPWQEPADLKVGLRMLDEVQWARRERIVRLGRCYARVARERLYLAVGFESLAQMVRQSLGLSVRTLERYRRLGEGMAALPALGDALGVSGGAARDVAAAGDGGAAANGGAAVNGRAAGHQGTPPGLGAAADLDLARAQLVLKVARPETVADWVRLAPRVTVLELQRATAMAGRGLEEEVLAAYEQAMARTTNTVALRAMQAPPPAPTLVAVHPDLPEAAVWFLKNIRPEPQRGFGKVKERDRFVCQNPECGRRTLRAEAHHLVFRSDGGSDEMDNGVSVCRACHLRLIHTGLVSVERKGDADVWTYPGGRVVMVFGPDDG
ncbi:MAG: HNH endonuclease [Deltaproteobacteria bacterium]|nr:HNH endonuclease [Deltaproteobacteria bacterium]